MSPRASQDRSAPYSQSVPAVQRTLASLEQLARAPEGLSLAGLSRATRISPSSLLAILRTLERQGYVARDASSRRYRVAAPLVALGRLAAHSLLPRAELARLSAEIERLAVALRGASETLAAASTRSGQIPAPFEARSGSASIWQPAAAGRLDAEEVRTFLHEGWLASLACLKDNGYPYTVPVWYEWDGNSFWIVAHARAEWAGYLTRNPQVSLTISEPEPPLRRVLVEGRAEAIDSSHDPRAQRVERRIAERYLGPEAHAYRISTSTLPRRIFCIVPEKLLTWRGLAPHPRYHSPQPSAATDQFSEEQPA